MIKPEQIHVACTVSTKLKAVEKEIRALAEKLGSAGLGEDALALWALAQSARTAGDALGDAAVSAFMAARRGEATG